MEQLWLAYQQTLDALLRRREELTTRKCEVDKRVQLLDFEIEEMMDVLNELKPYLTNAEAALCP